MEFWQRYNKVRVARTDWVEMGVLCVCACARARVCECVVSLDLYTMHHQLYTNMNVFNAYVLVTMA